MGKNVLSTLEVAPSVYLAGAAKSFELPGAGREPGFLTWTAGAQAVARYGAGSFVVII